MGSHASNSPAPVPVAMKIVIAVCVLLAAGMVATLWLPSDEVDYLRVCRHEPSGIRMVAIHCESSSSTSDGSYTWWFLAGTSSVPEIGAVIPGGQSQVRVVPR